MKLSRTTTTALLAAVALCSLIVRPAGAVPGPALPIIGGPTSIDFGGYLPTDNDAKHSGGYTQYYANFRYGLPVPNLIAVTRTIISLGVETGSRGGGHSTIVPLTISQVVSMNGGSPFAAGQGYIGAGLGVYFMNQSGISETTRVGGQALLGYNVTSAVFLEGKYQIVERGDGTLVSLGLRF